jgi:hypothetical protein
MSQTMRHPDVMHNRIESVLDSIAVLRGKLADREAELRQLLEITHEMWTDPAVPIPTTKEQQ